MHGGDYPYPGVQPAAWNVTKGKLHQIYFLATYLKILKTSILPVGQLLVMLQHLLAVIPRQYKIIMCCLMQ